MLLRLILNQSVPILLASLIGASFGCQTAHQREASLPLQPAASETLTENAQPIGSDVLTTDADRCGVLVMAHGGDDAWNRAVEKVVAPLRENYPIEVAFGMAKTSTMRAAVQRLEQRGVDRIAVVRMFISGESFLTKTQYILGLRNALENASQHDNHRTYGTMKSEQTGGSMHHQSSGDAPASSSSSHMMEPPTPIDSDSAFFLSAKGVASSTLIDDILIDRVRSLSTDPSKERILIVAHGPGDDEENKQWLADMHRRTERIRALGAFLDVRCETLREDWPGRRPEAEARIGEYVQTHSGEGGRVIVVPFRVAGFGPYKKVLAGLDYVADGRGFCPHPNMTAWVDQAARACLPSLPSARLAARSQ